MTLLDHFSVPYKGLKNGLHEFNFEIDSAFFNEFDIDIKVQNPFYVKLNLDKRHEIADAVFYINGKIIAECDRCLAPLVISVRSENRLRIKLGDTGLNNDEVLFIDENTSSVNFAQVIYEFIILSLPIMKMHEDINACDQEVIKKLKEQAKANESSQSIWNNLKGLKF
jgi:uncharacterized metal-binding protein YceD (DUF177 family)